MKVLISSRSFGKINSGAIEMLQNAGIDPVPNPQGKTLTEDEIIELLDFDTIGIIAGTEKITKKVLESVDSLKVVSRYGIGVDNVDLDTAYERGILVKNTPEAPTQAVAELTVTLILNLLRKINIVDQQVRSGEWNPPVGNLLAGKTVGILGVGRIGKTVVRLLEPFEVHFLAYESNPDDAFVVNHSITIVPLEDLLQASDIISLHMPMTEETKNILGSDQFKLMKQSAIVINTARGGLIDEEALVAAIEEKIIGGAAVDAYNEEPYKGRLIEFSNVILTPHIGSLTEETRKRMEIETVENLLNSI